MILHANTLILSLFIAILKIDDIIFQCVVVVVVAVVYYVQFSVYSM